MPLAAFFVLFCLGLLALGRSSRGYGLWLLLGGALGLAFTFCTQARLNALTERYDGETVTLTACVENVQTGYTRSTVRAHLRVESVDGRPARFCCQCDGLPLCKTGERIEGRFLLEAPAPADRPDSYADEVVFNAGYEARFASLGPADTFRAWSGRLQAKLSDALCQELEGDAAGALAAMIVGDRSRISSEMNGAYRASGLSHVLVVSGMHVTILCGIALPALAGRRRWLDTGQKAAMFLPERLGRRLYRKLGVRLVQLQMAPPRAARDGFHPGVVWRRRVRALWPVVLAVLLTGVTGFTPSVLRAGAAVLIGAAGVWVMAPTDALTSLALAGLGMSAFNSYAVCDVGFELSFAAVAGTLAGAELSRREKQKARAAEPLFHRLAAGLWDNVWEAGCIAVCASAATFPVLVLRGMSTSPYALVSSVAVLWLVQPIMLLGIAAALTGMVPFLRPVYRLCALGARVLVELLNGWAEMVAGWPGAELYFDTSYAAVVCLVLIALCLLADRWHVRLRTALPALLLVAAVGIGAGVMLGRDVVQVALVGGSRTPSAVLAQNGQAVVLYRGGSGGKAAVERWLARHGIDQAAWLIDLRNDPSGAALPAAERTVTAARLGDYTDYEVDCGDIHLEILHLRSGSAVRVTVDRWQLAAVSGTFELARQVEVDYLLAAPADPLAFRWREMISIGAGYTWMDEGVSAAGDELLLRPGGGALAR